jgi:hypothetical protein
MSREVRWGALLLLATILPAILVHALRGEWRPDLLVYVAGVLLVRVHGSLRGSPAHPAPARQST